MSVREGVIAFAGGAVDASTTRTRFLELHGDATLVTANAPYRTYRVGPLAVRGQSFYANVMFVDEALRAISMCRAREGESWDDVDDATLAADKATNDRWLAREFALKPSAAFAWGTVSSTLDRRTGCSSITITYRRVGLDP